MEVYKLNIASRQVTRITNNDVYDGNPAWSPDGRQIAFEGERTTEGVTDTDILVRRSDGSGSTTNETNNPGEDDLAPAWSPDGGRIAFHGGSTEDVYTVNVQTDAKRRLTTDGPASLDKDANWSPDGRRIAFENFTSTCPPNDLCKYTSVIYTVDSFNGSGKRPLARGIQEELDGGVEVTEPAYSPNGARITPNTSRAAAWRPRSAR